MVTEQKTRFEREALQHVESLRMTALGYTHNASEAEDLVQDTLLKACRAFDSFEQGTNCKAWLLKIMANTFINKYRSKKREKAYMERVISEETKENYADTRYGATDACDAAENLRRRYSYEMSDEVVGALNDMSPDAKSVVVLADLLDYSYREIADLLSIPIGTVMSRLFRARNGLKNALHDYAQTLGYT